MKNLTVCGVGSLGSNYVFIGRNLECNFKFIDFDKVEIKNLANQWYIKNNLGKNKANALNQNLLSFFGKSGIAIPHQLTISNTEQLLAGSDLVIDCFDNPDSRQLVQDWSTKHNKPCLHGGLAADAKFAIIAWNDKFEIDRPKVPNLPTCQDQDHNDFIIRVASYLITATAFFLKDGKKIGYEVYPTGSRQI